MADDIVTFGGPPRGSKRDAAETIESLFHAHYPGLVRAAFSSVGDWDLAEQLVQEAYLRLWRRWSTLPHYLGFAGCALVPPGRDHAALPG